MRIKFRITKKHLKGLQSDVEDSSEDEVKPIKLDMVEYNFKKAERDKYRLPVEQWVRNFREVNKRAAKDEDTLPIAEELLDFREAERDYLDFKLKMIEADLMKFESAEFVAQYDDPKKNKTMRANQVAMQALRKTFAKGFENKD